MSTVTMPYIDPDVEHVGVSRLRKLNATNLRQASKTLVIQDKDTPLAVLLAYEQFLCMQQKIEQLLETLELFSDDAERALLVEGLEDLRSGRTKSFSEIRRSLDSEMPG